jgi:hypothetical protein
MTSWHFAALYSAYCLALALLVFAPCPRRGRHFRRMR